VPHESLAESRPSNDILSSSHRGVLSRMAGLLGWLVLWARILLARGRERVVWWLLPAKYSGWHAAALGCCLVLPTSVLRSYDGSRTLRALNETNFMLQ